MLVDDTKTRIFIPDLESEIAEIEEQERKDREGKIEFLADIERKLNNLPKRVLRDQDEPAADENNQLVLYRVPTALSIPVEQDSVRRAITEARMRAREKAVEQAAPDATPRQTTSGQIRPEQITPENSSQQRPSWASNGTVSAGDIIPDDKDVEPMDVD
jgi:hypothetical protein